MSDERMPVLHRAALERVLLRAAELQAAAADVPETLTEEDLISVAGEVGITPVALKQALAEERMRVVLPNEAGWLASVKGPAFFTAARLVQGSASEVLVAIDTSFQRDENLMESRRFPDRISWVPRRGFAGALREMTRLDGRGFPLGRADEVSATVVSTSQGKVHIRVEASLVRRRAGATKSAIAGIVFGAAGATVLAALSVALPFAIGAGVAVAAASFWMSRGSYLNDARQTQLALEQALDRLEFGDSRRKSFLDQLLVAGRPKSG